MFGRKSVTDTHIEYIRENIDKLNDSVSTRMDEINKKFKDHTDKEEGWQRDISEKLPLCPESSHIKEQNGKLQKLAELVSEVKGSVRVWCYIFAGLMFALTVGTIIAGVFK